MGGQGLRRAVVLMLCLAAMPGCSQKVAEPGTAGGVASGIDLAGVVVDDAIRPLAGALIELDGGPGGNATSGADGTFSFAGVAPGAHVVRASKAGYSDTVLSLDVPSSGPPPTARLVLVADASTLAYAATEAIEGYVECGMYGASFRYATCGTGNVASLIVCSTFGICVGNVTDDRYIVVKAFDRQPDFLVAEVAWTATQDLGRELQVYVGTATPEDLAQASTNDYNGTIGPSPLYVTMNKTMLLDSGLGVDAYFLSQTFAAPSLKPCQFGACGVGLVMQQRFTYYLTSFFGYEPPPEWRFVIDGKAPPPPS